MSLLAVAVVGCGGSDSTHTAPFAVPNIQGSSTTPFPFNTTGVFVGTTGYQPILIKNTGSQSLVVSGVAYTGDSDISINPGIALASAPQTLISPPPPNITVPFDDSIAVGMACTPLAAATYNGKVEIKSNASNLPDIVIYMTCVGVKP